MNSAGLWTEFLSSLQRPLRVALPGFAPATVTSAVDNLHIKLSDSQALSVKLSSIRTVLQVIERKGYAVSSEITPLGPGLEWVLAVLQEVATVEVCANPFPLIFKRSHIFTNDELCDLFRVQKQGGIRWMRQADADFPAWVIVIQPDGSSVTQRIEGAATPRRKEPSGVNRALLDAHQHGSPTYLFRKSGSAFLLHRRVAIKGTDVSPHRTPDGQWADLYSFAVEDYVPPKVLLDEVSEEVTPSTLARAHGELSFRPKARLVQTLLGKEMVSNEMVALVELVKNSYDADATHVTVRLDPLNDTIELQDDGVGMSRSIIEEAWLQPGTPSKVRRTRSPKKGRRVLGNKGVGRFAASRLGSYLTLVTRAEGESKETTVYVDWDKFDGPDLFLDEVAFPWEQRQPRVFSGHSERHQSGTLLRVNRLSSDIRWDETRVRQLRFTLSRLLSPFSNLSDFSIRIETPYPSLSGPIEPSAFLQKPDYQITGDIRADGSYQLTFVHGSSEEIVNGQAPAARPSCGTCHMHLRVWDRDTPKLRELASKFDMNSSAIRNDLDQLAGISLYRDGFRVLPYGEPKNDWLRLDMRRVQNPTLRISNNQVVGYVRISSDLNPDLRDQSNRQGLIENQALQDLEAFIMAALAELEVRRYKLRRPAPQQHGAGNSLFDGLDIKDLQELITARYPKDEVLLEKVNAKSSLIDAQVGAIQETLSRYQRLSALGTVVDKVLHEGRQPIANISGELEILHSLPKGEGEKEIDECAEAIETNNGRLDELFDRIEPFSGRKRNRAETFALEDAIRDALWFFRDDLKNVHVSIPMTSTTFVGRKPEIVEVFINLFRNAAYWLQSVPIHEREISVALSQSNDEIIVIFEDSGPGVPDELQDIIFQPWVSSRPNGTGLGLTMAGEIVQEHSGVLELATGSLLGACFRIRLPKGHSK